MGLNNWSELRPMDVNYGVIRFNVIVKREARDRTQSGGPCTAQSFWVRWRVRTEMQALVCSSHCAHRGRTCLEAVFFLICTEASYSLEVNWSFRGGSGQYVGYRYTWCAIHCFYFICFLHLFLVWISCQILKLSRFHVRIQIFACCGKTGKSGNTASPWVPQGGKQQEVRGSCSLQRIKDIPNPSLSLKRFPCLGPGQVSWLRLFCSEMPRGSSSHQVSSFDQA